MGSRNKSFLILFVLLLGKRLMANGHNVKLNRVLNWGVGERSDRLQASPPSIREKAERLREMHAEQRDVC